ncbi:2-dehydropantoate 2-reductase [Alphaproteobacteria bacterium]|nr:2-dehydropantoate 2-reductase [Alphaproteobacteria bacterium]
MVNICVYGAGAIGGYIGCCLSNAGANVSLIARGPHKEAINKNGVTLISNGKSENFNLKVTENPKDLDTQDYIILGVKAHAIQNIATSLKPLMNDKTVVLSAVNGLPWWYFYKANSGTNLDNNHIETVDPKGLIWDTIDPKRALGCVVYPACEIASPGVIRHIEGNRISLGEPDGINSERLKILSSLMIAGGLKAPQKKHIRDEIWIKLWGNCSFNPISAITGASLDLIGNDPGSRRLVRELMQECQNVGEALGIKFRVSIEDRINGAASIIGHKPSTRQDIEMKRPLEIDPIMSAIIEIGVKLNIPTPMLKNINSILKLKAEYLNLYTRDEAIEVLTV